MNILTTEKRVAVISALVDGCSVRTTLRMTVVAQDTILKLLGIPKCRAKSPSEPGDAV